MRVGFFQIEGARRSASAFKAGRRTGGESHSECEGDFEREREELLGHAAQILRRAKEAMYAVCRDV